MSKESQNEQVRTLTALLKARLSKKRFTHSVNVARAAFALAERWGADPQRAYLAGLLHDCCKELPFEEQQELMRQGPFVVSDTEWQCKPVWHGIAAASYMHTELGIEDAEILSAARWHTVGKANMTRLEEIVYMADLISAERTYRDVDRFRKMAQNDLDKAMLCAFEYAIDSVMKKQAPLPVSTVEAYNYYLARMNARTDEKSKSAERRKMT
ncbi:MAG: bis(5'-nucleosyl)-tetraphosphatase (symmetrical) YqeK [Oscillospiraceae bacterium]|nr:bis(5'-nucleosyl)-tetraphosphatase (symmetrical) YqeK [Oscillospiraceae bacterium]MCR4759987.1 bis(5'-nucleosyl)-tetraphosphatase (symmetrical) YqeK [Oscillospiraceae bacterium]